MPDVSNYPNGIVITAAGYQLVADLLAQGKNTLEFSSVLFGNSCFSSVEAMRAATNLAAADINSGVIIEGSSSLPVTDKIYFEPEEYEDYSSFPEGIEGKYYLAKDTGKTYSFSEDGGFVEIANYEELFKHMEIKFVVEYRNNSDECIHGMKASEYPHEFRLNEFGVFAKDPINNTDVLLIYGQLGDYPQSVPPYLSNAIDVRRFPVCVAISYACDVSVKYEPQVYVTYQQMIDYVTTIRGLIYSEDIMPTIEAHNSDPDAHEPHRARIQRNTERIEDVEERLGGNATKYSAYFHSYEEASQYAASGIYNAAKQRMEF